MSQEKTPKGLVSHFQETVANIGTHSPRPVGLGLAHGSMYSLIYRPHNPDDQQPHEQDELYIAMSGSGTFVVDDERHPFGTGDMLFVPAHAVHRFEDFTDDLLLWVVFYGPKGGESDGR